ncbi:MAG TPA: hypothetical protein VH352_17165 [Pseudonocardiaceae bacterium]|jgi:hypothetical protein|nr:hypothetical protein [Pseudonocardiaceae bacterium]
MTVTTRNAISGAAPAPDWLRNLVGARTHYEENLGWPATIEIEPHRVVIETGTVLDAVTIPADLAQPVLVELRIALQSGPVITAPGAESWTFLTEPVMGPRRALPAELHAAGVRGPDAGTRVTLPSETGSPYWVEPPRSRHCLPPCSAVIGTARRVVARQFSEQWMTAA